MKNLFLFLLTLHSFLIFSQQNKFELHDYHFRRAEQLDSIQKFDEALTHIDSALASFDYYPYDYFSAFKIAYHAGDMSKAHDYLVAGTKKGLDTDGWFDNDLDSFLTSGLGSHFLLKKDSLMNIYSALVDSISVNQLDELVRRDQSLRNGSNEMFYQDSLNFESLIKLSETRGFPTFPTTGYGCNYAHLLLWHHRGPEYPNSEQWRRILPLIEARIEEGLLAPNFLEMFETFNREHDY